MNLEHPLAYALMAGAYLFGSIPSGVLLPRLFLAADPRRIAKLSFPPVASVIPSPRPYSYRGKAEFHLASCFIRKGYG